MPSKKQPSKRIHKVTILRMMDESPDTSHLGEYSDKATSEYSIDRAHNDDCQSLAVNHQAGVDQLERIIDYLERERFELGNDDASGNVFTKECLDDAVTVVQEKQDELQECDCSKGGRWDNRQYRYFNPSGNYDGDTPENIIEYTRQDYERMEAMSRFDWHYVGVRAEAEYSLGVAGHDSAGRAHYLIQKLSSGGLWGIESDAGDYFAEVEAEQLSELRSQLSAIGFSKRAISAAFKDIQKGGNAR